jgi:flagellar biosynthesis protein FlhF
MKIRRYLGTDMRDALRQIRAELGNDAVILSTRPLGSGVEVSAAVDAGQLQDIALAPPAAPPTAPPAMAAAQLAPEPPPAVPTREQQAMSEELRTLRQLLERQLAALAWNDFTRREPLRAQALTELTDLGLARDVALMVLAQLPPEAEIAARGPAHFELLARVLPTSESPLLEGGALAVIGAAGAGRTTVLAKLALRWVLEHGADSLAIVTIDDEHIGAAAQAQALGRLLGVASFRFADAAACLAASARISGYDCLLIDAPALSASAEANAALAQALGAAVPALRSLLVLPATTQADVLAETLRRASAFAPRCCALTHYDEAMSLGAACSALIRAQLPLALVGDGSQLTDELRPARAPQLIARAAELARLGANHADEDLLARRYGREINAAA